MRLAAAVEKDCITDSHDCGLPSTDFIHPVSLARFVIPVASTIVKLHMAKKSEEVVDGSPSTKGLGSRDSDIGCESCDADCYVWRGDLSGASPAANGVSNTHKPSELLRRTLHEASLRSAPHEELRATEPGVYDATWAPVQRCRFPKVCSCNASLDRSDPESPFFVPLPAERRSAEADDEAMESEEEHSCNPLPASVLRDCQQLEACESFQWLCHRYDQSVELYSNDTHCPSCNW